MRAGRMFAQGACQVDVVKALGVSAQTALRWYRAWLERPHTVLFGIDPK
ncbi:helix-turn-helix domain-containing protein [Actinopolymorpha alba]